MYEATGAIPLSQEPLHLYYSDCAPMLARPGRFSRPGSLGLASKARALRTSPSAFFLERSSPKHPCLPSGIKQTIPKPRAQAVAFSGTTTTTSDSNKPPENRTLAAAQQQSSVVDDDLAFLRTRPAEEAFWALRKLGIEHCQRAVDYHISLRYFNEALGLAKQVGGERHPDVALCLMNIAMVFRRQSNHKEALELYEQAHGMFIEKYGRIDPNVAVVLGNMATAHVELGDLNKALDLQRQVLEIFDSVPSAELPFDRAGIAHNNMAMTLEALEKQEEALAHYREALRLWQTDAEENQVNIAQVQTHMAEILGKQGFADEALALCDESLSTKLALYGDLHPKVADTLAVIAMCKFTQGKKYEASVFGRRAASILEQTLGASHPYSVEVRGLWGADE